MGLGFTAGRNYISTSSLIDATIDLICYFHNEFIYHNGDLNFPFINKNATYENLEKEEKDIELMILNPILKALGSMYSLGEVNFDTNEFDLLDKFKEKLDDYSTTLKNEEDEDNYYDNSYDEYEYISLSDRFLKVTIAVSLDVRHCLLSLIVIAVITLCSRPESQRSISYASSLECGFPITRPSHRTRVSDVIRISSSSRLR